MRMHTHIVSKKLHCKGVLDYIAYSGEYTGAFSFSSENLNNSRVCRVFASEEFAECSS